MTYKCNSCGKFCQKGVYGKEWRSRCCQAPVTEITKTNFSDIPELSEEFFTKATLRMPKFDGYKEASKIDSQINKLLEEFNIDKDNVMEWWRFSRQLKTGLDIIDIAIIAILKAKG
jgi:hypothetical protein